MAITGAHMLLYSSEPEAVRDVFRGLGWSHVDAGEGWLIFRMPPSELGIHPADVPKHEISLMCDDIEETLQELAALGVTRTAEVEYQEWGAVAYVVFPGDLRVMVYEPRHPTP